MLPNYVLSIVVPIVFLPFIAWMAVQAVQEQGWLMVSLFFLLFAAVHTAFAAVAVVLMRERWQHLLLVPVYRIVYEPLRAYLLYTSVYLAVRGVRAGWNKLSRTGAMDAVLSPVPPLRPALNTHEGITR